jgi:hypothetical protein
MRTARPTPLNNIYVEDAWNIAIALCAKIVNAADPSSQCN